MKSIIQFEEEKRILKQLYWLAHESRMAAKSAVALAEESTRRADALLKEVQVRLELIDDELAARGALPSQEESEDEDETPNLYSKYELGSA